MISENWKNLHQSVLSVDYALLHGFYQGAKASITLFSTSDSRQCDLVNKTLDVPACKQEGLFTFYYYFHSSLDYRTIQKVTECEVRHTLPPLLSE